MRKKVEIKITHTTYIRSRSCQVQTLNEQESEKLLQQSVLADVRDAFDSSVYGMRGMPPPTFGDGESEDGQGGGGGGGSGVEGGAGGDGLIVPDLLSPSGPTDAQTLALMLQQQLDAINNEIRYVYPELFFPEELKFKCL